MNIRPESVIALRNVHANLGDNQILKGVTLSIRKGLTFILGLNGSGKTTLIRCLSRAIPFQGEIRIQDQNLAKLTYREFSQTVSIVHQKWNLPFRVSVWDFVLMGRFPYLNWLGVYSEEDRRIAQEQMEALDIFQFHTRFLDQVSGGELQRIFLARALVQDTPIMLLDEPAQSLDPPAKRELYALLEKLASEDKTVICSSHDIEVLPFSRSSIVGIHSGNLVYEGACSQLTPEIEQRIYDFEGLSS